MADLSDLTAQCIRCGFCLESCPTFVLSGKETESPRGRIYLARSMESGVLPWSADNRQPFDSCVGCRACEPACPSGVRYGEILELARSRLERVAPRKQARLLLDVVTNPVLFRLQAGLASLVPGLKAPRWLARHLTPEGQRAEVPPLRRVAEWPPLESAGLPPVKADVALLEGCAMKVLFPDVHEATERLLRRVGIGSVRIKGCCGALHAHAGFLEKAHALALRLTKQLGPDRQLVVNSAGCGSWLKEAGLPVLDATVFLAAHGLVQALRTSRGLSGTVATYHDACHLAHGQGVRTQPRELLSAVPGLRLVPMVESDTCCGSGGVYNVLQPRLAQALLDRKWSNICLTGSQVVVTGNPGCLAWIEQASRRAGGSPTVQHTLSLLESSFSGLLDNI